MYYYRCIVTPKYICTFVLSSLRVASDWNFEIMKISLPIKLPWTLPFCPKRFQNRCSGEHNQNYDHIRTANWKTKRSQCRFYSVKKQFEDFLWVSLMSPRPCYLARVLYEFSEKTTIIMFKVVMYTADDCIHFVSIALF